MSDKTQEKRVVGTPFQPGNPGGGRPKTDPKILEAFRKMTPDAIRVLGDILKNEDSKDSDRLRAAETILDRALGKAIQAVDVDANVTNKMVLLAPEQFTDLSKWQDLAVGLIRPDE